METGECDLAIAGFYKELPDTFYQQKLREESFVVLSSSEKLASTAQLNLNTFLNARHIVTTLTGDLDGIVDKALRNINLTRNVVAGVSSFLTPPLIAKDTSCILVCLESIAKMYAFTFDRLTIHECPIDLPKVNISQIWHGRTHQDPMRRWLRNEIHQVLSN